MNDILAHDRMGSVRMTDEDGRLHVATTPISKATVNAYWGREIPGAEGLGLAPDRLYSLLRDPAELARAAPSFNALPVLAEHAHVTAAAPRADLVVGTTGTDARFASPYLTNSLAIWNAGAIHNIRSGAQRELSCAYRYTPVMEAGEFEGQPYDGRMTNIRGNHVALVPSGRAGPDVVVADAKPKDMSMVQTHTAPTAGQVFARLGTAFASGGLAMTASLSELEAWLKHNGMADVAAQCGSLLPPAQAGAGASTPAKEQGAAHTVASPPGTAEQALPQSAAQASTQPAETAQDSAVQAAVATALAAERTRAAQTHEARTLVRPLVGDVLGMDSAADILRYALAEQGVRTDGVNEPGLKALVLACLGASATPAATPTAGAVVGAADHAAPLATRFGVHAPRKL